MNDALIQLTCPHCDHEDQARASDLEGQRLLCEKCGTYMERDDGLDDEGEVNAALRALCEQTGTQSHEWDEVDGPTTGVGIERHYVHTDGREAYTCDDQGAITVSVGAD